MSPITRFQQRQRLLFLKGISSQITEFFEKEQEFSKRSVREIKRIKKMLNKALKKEEEKKRKRR